MCLQVLLISGVQLMKFTIQEVLNPVFLCLIPLSHQVQNHLLILLLNHPAEIFSLNKTEALPWCGRGYQIVAEVTLHIQSATHRLQSVPHSLPLVRASLIYQLILS